MNSNWSYSPETPNLGQNQRFLELCDLEIWRMTLKNNRAPLLCYFKLCASFHTHWWIQIWVTVRKRSIWVKIGDFLSRTTLKINGWPWKTIEHLFLCYSKLCAILHNHWWIQTGVTVQKHPIWVKINDFLAMWPCNLTYGMTLKNNRAPHLCYFKLCALFCSHWWIQTGVTVRKHPI